MKNCKLWMLGVSLLITLISCTARPPDLSVYALLDDAQYIEKTISLYNKSQRRYKITFSKIVPSELRALLENSIQRKNTTLLVAPQDISSKGSSIFFHKLFPEYKEVLQIDRTIALVEETIAYTANYGMPLYYYDLRRNEVDSACLSIVRAMYSNEDADALLDFFAYLASPEINALSLIYHAYPVYKDAGISSLTIQDAKRVDTNIYDKELVDEELILKDNTVSLRK